MVVRRAYADWSSFDEDRRALTRSHVELIDIPQRMGASRKNAADIKMAVDALEMAFERGYIATFVIGTGDSDFTPLVHKLRALNKRVVGVGVEESTSALLPPACDEFLYYDRLVDIPPAPRRRDRTRAAEPFPPAGPPAAGPVTGPPTTRTTEPPTEPTAEPTTEPVTEPATGQDERPRDVEQLAVLVVQTVAGLQASSSGAVTASILKRTLLRKDPTFNEADFGFRAFGEMLRHLAERDVVELSEGPAKGDPEVALPERGDRDAAFALLRSVVAELQAEGAPVALSGLKNQVRRVQPDFSEKKLGYRSFLQFCRAAATDGVVALEWSAAVDDYLLAAAEAAVRR